jgi:hypothetical protein
MANTIRVVNGTTIQVRTGVLQGIGPQGPRGQQGLPGPDGPQGQQGETGPMGQILALGSRMDMTTTNPLAANTDTVISFGPSVYDGLSAFSSQSNILLSNAGDYLLGTWLQFGAGPATTSLREVWFRNGSGLIIARTGITAPGGVTVPLTLTFPWRTAGGETINVLARTADACTVSTGAMTVNRVGSGPPGVAGPQGPQGNIGPTGAKGDTGGAGSATTGFTTYAKLKGPN